jgi:hypothetical protein
LTEQEWIATPGLRSETGGTRNREEIAQADALQRIFKKVHGRDRCQVGSAVTTAECEEMKFSRLLVAKALAFHVC